MPSNFIKTLEAILKEKRPDIDIRDFTAVHDLLLKTMAILMDPLNSDITALREAQSLLSPNLSEADMDLLIANEYLSRITGDYATGVGRVYFSSAVACTFTTSDTFIADNGAMFKPIQDFYFPQSIIRLNTEGSLYYIDIPLVATEPGTTSRIAAHQLNDLRGTSLSFVRIDNPYPFAGGVNKETNTQLRARGADAITVRDLVSGRGCRTQLQANFPIIERVFTAGFLDPEQNRDIFEGVHIGGQADAYIKPVTFLAEQVKLLTPDINGSYVLSNGLGATGDSKRPVVFFDAVRLLGADPERTPLDPPLNRQEYALVPLTPLVTQGEYEEVTFAYNPTLNQYCVVAIERVSDTEKYVVYGKLRTQGTFVTPLLRISSMGTDLTAPHINVSSTTNRAFVFWSEKGTIKGKVIDASAVPYTVYRDTFDIPGLTGTDPVVGKMSSSFGGDGHIHVAFTRRMFTPLGDYQDNPWYFRLDAAGASLVGFDARQLVYGFAGQNRDASIIAQGATTTLIVTTLFSSEGAGPSNLCAIQIDDAGNYVGSSTPRALTAGYGTNDMVTVLPGPSDTIHAVWRKDGRSVGYLRINKVGMGYVQPPVAIVTRSLPLGEVTAAVSPYNSVYAAWVESIGDFTDVFTVKADMYGKKIGPVNDVTTTNYFSFNPTIRVDTAGAIVLTWTDGIRGLFKPFFTKRAPQEFHLVVADANYRYSAREAITVVPEVPAASGLGLDIRWSNLLPAIQNFVSSDDNRTIVSGLLVRNQIPAAATCAVKFGPAGGALTELEAQVLIENFFTQFVGTTLEISTLITLLFENGASSVAPFEVIIKIDQPDGSIETLRSSDRITLPRGVFLVPSGVTATYR